MMVGYDASSSPWSAFFLEADHGYVGVWMKIQFHIRGCNLFEKLDFVRRATICVKSYNFTILHKRYNFS